ncbi:MAG: family 78 glycoside hydrolase catalytic domain [Pseudobutyrivibrio sp.]|nr:family 78 glycoside hydrolase catalytic domain [Pseudobutyrivibrio sp.]
MLEGSKWIRHPLDNRNSRLIPVFRKKFIVQNKILKATLYITAHGVYEAKINGKNVSTDVFMPGLTSYYNRIQVQEYDITELLEFGENEWITTVGDGWWRWNNNFGYHLALCAKLILEREDGKSIIVTDTTFDVGTGAIIKSDLQSGELYDSRINKIEYMKAIEDNFHTDSMLIPMEGVGIKEKEQFVGIPFRDKAGNLVVDFQQNICGYVEAAFTGLTNGQVVKMIHGETLDLDGIFTTANCDGGKEIFQCNTFISAGKEKELYKPSFCYAGFRYLKLIGLNKDQEEASLGKKGAKFKAIAVYSDLDEVGDFECSNELINRLVKNARWSQKGNFLDVPVDCPTRERNAWTGDAQIYVNTACYFMDCARFFLKWLKDQTIEQYKSGKVGITFPSTSSVHNPEELSNVKKRDSLMELAGPEGNGNIGEDSVGWGDSTVHLPFVLYQFYGNKSFVEEHYQTAVNWVNYSLSCMKEKNPLHAQKPWYKNGDGNYIYDTRFHYGEWNEPLPPDKEVIEFFKSGKSASEYVEFMAKYGKPEVATAYTKRSCDELAQLAEILGKKEDSQKFRKISREIKRCYNKYLIDPNGIIQEGHQAAYVRALAFDLVSSEKKPLVVAQLKQEIEKAHFHLNTGFLSTSYLLPVLVENNLEEYAFKLLEQTELPSWLHPILVGATTIPENWDGFDKKRDSLNHYSFGAVCQFLFEYVAGIRPNLINPGFKEVILKPVPGGSLTWAKARYKSVNGLIEVEWRKDNGVFIYKCKLPPKTQGTIYMPNGDIRNIQGGSSVEMSCSI